MSNSYKQEVGRNVRRYREQAELTQEELGAEIGLVWKQSAITAIYRTEQGEWSIKRLEKIAEALDITIGELLKVEIV